MQKRELAQNLILSVSNYVYLPDENFDYLQGNLTENNTWRTDMSYDATQVLIKGLQQLPQPNLFQSIQFKFNPSLQRLNLQKNITQTNFKVIGKTGKITFDNNGDRLDANIEILKVSSLSCTYYGYAFIPVKYSQEKLEQEVCQK